MNYFDAAKLLRFPAGRRSGGGPGNPAEVHDDVLVSPTRPHVVRITDLLTHPQASGVAFQSVLVSAIQVLEDVLSYQRHIARSAISLAQRDKITEMIHSLEDTNRSLSAGLNEQGRRMLSMRPPVAPVIRGEDAWWYLLAETAEAAENGAALLAQIVSGQPRGGPARTLSSVVARILHRQHQDLIQEADTWRQ
jgi:hypothetical protein